MPRARSASASHCARAARTRALIVSLPGSSFVPVAIHRTSTPAAAASAAARFASVTIASRPPADSADGSVSRVNAMRLSGIAACDFGDRCAGTGGRIAFACNVELDASDARNPRGALACAVDPRRRGVAAESEDAFVRPDRDAIRRIEQPPRAPRDDASSVET